MKISMFSPFFSFGLRFIWKHGGIGRVGHHQLVEKKISRWEKASDFSHAPFPPPLQMYSFPQNANKFPHLLENIQIYFCKYISTSFRQHANIFHFLWTLNQHANLLFFLPMCHYSMGLVLRILDFVNLSQSKITL